MALYTSQNHARDVPSIVFGVIMTTCSPINHSLENCEQSYMTESLSEQYSALLNRHANVAKFLAPSRIRYTSSSDPIAVCAMNLS